MTTNRPHVRALALAAAAMLIAALAASVSRSPARAIGGQLIGSGSSSIALPASVPGTFGITGTLGELYPGVHGSLVLTVSNPNPVALTITSLTVTAPDVRPVACPVSNLAITDYTGTPAMTVLPHASAMRSLPATLATNAPNGCQGATWPLTFRGTAGTNDTLATATTLVSSSNASILGSSVTFTATVKENPLAGDPVPSGIVTFMDGAATLATVPLDSSGKAQLVTSTLVIGSHPITATYASDTYYAASSGSLSQVVNYSSCVTGNQNGGLTVSSGQAICVASSGKVNGGATVKSGGILHVNGGSVNGGVTVQAGGTLVVNGATVNGGVTATAPKGVTVCAAGINGGLSVSGSTGPVLIGDGAGCGQNNVSGGVTLTNNTVGTQVSLNKITGGLSCSGNAPPPTNAGKPNVVTGSKTGQCASL